MLPRNDRESFDSMPFFRDDTCYGDGLRVCGSSGTKAMNTEAAIHKGLAAPRAR